MEGAERVAAPWQVRFAPWLTNLALLLLGGYFVELTWTGTQEFHHFIHGFSEGLFGQFAIYLGAIALVEQSPTNRWTLPVIALAAVAARVVAIAAPPFLSSDIYRYVWDGMVQNAGINPYRYVPADPHLRFLEDAANYPFINRREYAHTIYPPGAQLLYLLVARIHPSVLWMKVVMAGFEAAACGALLRAMRLLRLPRERLLLYLWHPVCVWEIGSSGHVDAVIVALIAFAIAARLGERPLRASGLLAAATLVKFYPLVLLPAFVRKRVGAPLAILGGMFVVAYLPYLGVGRAVLGYLPGYTKEEGIESGTHFFPLQLWERTLHVTVDARWYLAASMLGLAGVGWWAYRRGGVATNCISSGLVLATALMLCFCPHYPWYFLWMVPFLTLWPWRPAFYMVMAVTFMLGTRLGVPGEPLYQMNELLYGGFFLLLLVDGLERWWRRRSAGVEA